MDMINNVEEIIKMIEEESFYDYEIYDSMQFINIEDFDNNDDYEISKIVIREIIKGMKDHS